jgi:hypothetical protein
MDVILLFDHLAEYTTPLLSKNRSASDVVRAQAIPKL